MRKPDGSFTWSAWNPAKWDHYHHAGIQVNAYRECPFPFSVPRTGWRHALITFLLGCIGAQRG